MRPATDQPPPSRRLTVQEAALQLGVTIDAIRGRIKRGTLSSTKEEDGTVYVFLEGIDQSQDQSDASQQLADDQPGLVEVLKEQNDYLRHQLEVWQEEARRKDHIIAALAERIPAIEAPSEAPGEPRHGSGASPEASGHGEVRTDSQEPAKRRSWLYRFFFGP